MVDTREITREPYTHFFAFRITETQYKLLKTYYKKHELEIYEPIRNFIKNELLPSLALAIKEEERLNNSLEDQDEVPVTLP